MQRLGNGAVSSSSGVGGSGAFLLFHAEEEAALADALFEGVAFLIFLVLVAFIGLPYFLPLLRSG